MVSSSLILCMLVLSTSVASFSFHPHVGRVSGSVNVPKNPVKMEAELEPKLREKVSGTSQRIKFGPFFSKPTGIVVHPLQNRTSGSPHGGIHQKVALLQKAEDINVKNIQESSPSGGSSNAIQNSTVVLEIETTAAGNVFWLKGKITFK